MKMKKSRVQALLIFIAASVALLAQIYWGKSTTHSSLIIEKAVKAYNSGDIEEALSLIEAEPNQFIPLRDGCELLISVFAESNKLSLLENAATRCLDAGKAEGIAHEGYAKALLLQGRTLEAIMALEKEAETIRNPRIHGALASLYKHQKDFEGVGNNLIAAIEIADVWSPWIARALKLPDLVGDKKFVSRLIDVVSKKQKVNQAAEKQLIEVAKTLGLEKNAGKIEVRWH